VTLHVGQVAPDFEQDTTNGSIRFHEWISGSWCLLFSHPQDFAPASIAELATATLMKPEWSGRGIRVIGLCVGSSDGHAQWQRTLEAIGGFTLNFPVIADADRTVSTLYGMTRADTDPSPPRHVFLIDPHKKIRVMCTYAPSTGCNFKEMLLAFDDLQPSGQQIAATPCDHAPIEHGDVPIPHAR
jgi:alkyl hydroperoxide reductase subunit AhpC